MEASISRATCTCCSRSCCSRSMRSARTARNPSNARASAGTAMNRPKPHDQFHLNEGLDKRMNAFVVKKDVRKLRVEHVVRSVFYAGLVSATQLSELRLAVT